MKLLRQLKAIRQTCLDCSAGSAKNVAYCACDGHNSTLCQLWMYRFGKGPDTVRRRIGAAMITPELMPGPGVDLDSLPQNPREYCQTVEREPAAVA